MKKIIGYALISLPFAALGFHTIAEHGIKGLAQIVFGTVAVIVVIFAGVWLTSE